MLEESFTSELQLSNDLVQKLAVTAFRNIISRIHFLAKGDVCFVADIVNHLKPFEARRGETIVNVGDLSEELIFILSGNVQMYSKAISSKGQKIEVLFGQITPGNYFCDLEFMRATLGLAKYSAVGKCHLLAVGFHTLSDKLLKYEETARSFYNECVRRYDCFVEASDSEVVVMGDGVARSCFMYMDGDVIRVEESTQIASATSNTLNFFVSLRLNKSKEKEIVEESRYDLTRRKIIHPDDEKLFAWDTFIGVLVLYSILSVSIVLSFSVEQSQPMKDFDLVIDACFIVDMIIVTRTAYLNEEDVVVTIPNMIFLRYLKTWFFPDLLSSIPFDEIVGTAAHGNLVSVTILKAIRAFRIMRLLKLKRLSKIVVWCEDNLSINPGIFEILKFVSYIFFAAHLVACLWWVLATECSSDTWHRFQGYDKASLKVKYVASLYWTITTMTTVGFGDIVPVNSAERIMACVVMLLGGMAFGYIVGNMSAMIGNLSQANAAIAQRVQKVSHFEILVHIFC